MINNNISTKTTNASCKVTKTKEVVCYHCVAREAESIAHLLKTLDMLVLNKIPNDNIKLLIKNKIQNLLKSLE